MLRKEFIWIVSFCFLIGRTTTQTDDVRECYQFTWPGEKNVTECDEDDVTSPCFTPFILTEPSYYPPNVTYLNDYCDSVGCPEYKCTKKGGSCLKWSWYDIDNQLLNYTVFCGYMSDVTDDSKKATPIDEGCFTYDEGSQTKEACVCNSYDLCNAAPHARVYEPLLYVFVHMIFTMQHLV